jgi:enoyl-[acyl-carrier protein] reductase I
MGFLTGKRALIVGLASNRSIAYGIAQAMHREGAELAFSCQNEKLLARSLKMAEEFNSKIVIECDASSDEQITQLFTSLKTHWDQFDILVHSIAYAPADQLDGDYLDCITREGFRIAHDVSSYTFAALAKQARPYLRDNGSLITMTYLGADRALPNYNVMGLAKASLEANVRYMANSLGPKGIRVNAISAGPIRTLAASGIKDFRKMLSHNDLVAPLRRSVTTEQVGNVAAFLCSDLASGITGEILFVDAGYHITAMGELNSQQQVAEVESSENL